jgi:ribonuclease VapC
VNVLDTSVILAVVQNEPGSVEAATFFESALISAVNLSELLQKAVRRGISPDEVLRNLKEAEIGIVSLDARLATEAAELWPRTRAKGLSLADRSCLALALAVNGIAVTADRAWAELDIPELTVHVLTR